jgi:hypothetical protein
VDRGATNLSHRGVVSLDREVRSLCVSQATTANSPLRLCSARGVSPYARLAREIGCTYSYLYNAVQGHTVPSPLLRDQMPAALSTPLSKLFTAEVLALEYDNRGRPRKTEAGAA